MIDQKVRKTILADRMPRPVSSIAMVDEIAVLGVKKMAIPGALETPLANLSEDNSLMVGNGKVAVPFHIIDP